MNIPLYALIRKAVFGLLLMTICSASAQDFVVNNYDVFISVKAEGYFDVVEKYEVEFLRPRHGIYRLIQTQYNFKDQDGKISKRGIRISDVEVPGHRFEKTSNFRQRLESYFRIRIGDPDRTVIGPVSYEIRYRVKNAFVFDDDKTWFYWNVKPDGWDADFKRIGFSIELPEGVMVGSEDFSVYSGTSGITQTTMDFDLNNSGSTLSGINKAGFVSYQGDFVTVLIGLPPDSIVKPSAMESFLTRFGWIFLVGGIFFGFYRLWLNYGKDEDVGSASSYYPPRQIDPAMAGYLLNDHYDSNDLISLIPYWGSQGYIKLEEIEGKGFFGSDDIKITRIKPLGTDASEYEKTIFNALFDGSFQHEDHGEDDVMVSDLKNTFYKTMNTASKELSEAAKKYYDPSSRKIRNRIYLFGFLGGIALTVITLFIWGILGGVLVGLSFITIMILNFFMIKKNRLGNEIYSELTGFKRFIKVAEERRLKTLLQSDPSYFETTMGYALAFGMFKKWSGKFDDLNIPPPQWYSGSHGIHSSMNSFSRSFTSSMTSMTSNMVSSPSSSGSGGGGSSGGGFGGGGGGSW